VEVGVCIAIEVGSHVPFHVKTLARASSPLSYVFVCSVWKVERYWIAISHGVLCRDLRSPLLSKREVVEIRDV
jgi:hypothetical protein